MIRRFRKLCTMRTTNNAAVHTVHTAYNTTAWPMQTMVAFAAVPSSADSMSYQTQNLDVRSAGCINTVGVSSRSALTPHNCSCHSASTEINVVQASHCNVAVVAWHAVKIGESMSCADWLCV
jgi:hypothetical protein